ncbi:hypothetical protein TSMEX_004102 [Taenia solium]|eukprot:TsM_000245700 transcript=TsM_000245700 gene=TsM_000245700
MDACIWVRAARHSLHIFKPSNDSAQAFCFVGTITNFMDGKNAIVRFRYSAETQEVPVNLCLPMKGLNVDNSLEATHFQLNDPVLVKMQNPQMGVQCWVPGHVASRAQFSTDSHQPLNRNYSIQLFYGSRRLFKSCDIVKISPKLHDAIVNYIVNLIVDDRGNCMQSANGKPKSSGIAVLKRKKYTGKSMEGSKNLLSVPPTPPKAKTTRFEGSHVLLANMGDPIQDPSRRRLSKLNKSPRISSTVPRQSRITKQMAEKDDSGQHKENISPIKKEKKGLGEGVEIPDRVWTKTTNIRTSSTNSPSDYADYFADGYDEIDEWDKTQPLTSSVFGVPELEEEAVGGHEDAKIVVDLPKAKCRLTVSASINQSKASSKTHADSKFVDVTLFLEGKRGSYQQKVNLAIPDEDSKNIVEAGNLAISNEGSQGRGEFKVAKETKKSAEGKRESYQQAGNFTIPNEDGQRSGKSGVIKQTKMSAEGKRASYQLAGNLAIPSEDGRRSSGSGAITEAKKVAETKRESCQQTGKLAIPNKGSQRNGGPRVAKEAKKAAEDKRASYQQTGNLAISNENGQRSGGPRAATETKKVPESNVGSYQHTVNLDIPDDGAQMIGGSTSSKVAEKAGEDKKKSYQQVISLTISDEDSQRSGGPRIVEVAEKAAEGKKGSYRLATNVALSDDDDQKGGESGVHKTAKKMSEVPFPEMPPVDMERFWIQESDERYIVTDDYEESRSGDPTTFMEEGPIMVYRITDQPVHLGTSMDWVPEDKCILQMSHLRFSETSMIEEWCAMEPLADVGRNAVHASENISMAPNHVVCHIERISSYSAFNFLVNCLTTEKQLMTLVKKLASFSGEWVVAKTLEVVECVNRIQLIFVEAFALQSSVKESLHMHRRREVSFKNLRVLEAGNNSSTSQKALVQKSNHLHQAGTKRLPERGSDHRTRRFSGKTPPHELIDEGIKDNHFIESGNDLEPCSPITAQSVSELERRIHSAFLTSRRCRI